MKKHSAKEAKKNSAASAQEEAARAQEAASLAAGDTDQAKADTAPETEVEETTQAAETNGTAPEEKKPPRDRRRFHFGAMATGLSVLVLALVVLLNVVVGILADRFPISLDLTKEQRYTLSQESLSLAKSIDKDVRLTIFMEEGFLKEPSTGEEIIDTIFRQLHAFVGEYAARSNGHVKVSYVDLTNNPVLSSEYGDDISSGSLLFEAGDRRWVITVDDMISQEQVLNQSTYQYDYQYYSLVEQKLASSFLTVLSDRELVVTLLTGNGEQETVIAGLAETYRNNGYTVKTLDFNTAEAIDENCDTLLSVGPTKDFSADQIDRLTTWLSNEGKLGRNFIVMCDYTASCPNLYEFLETYYGIKVTQNLVYETSSANMLSSLFAYPTQPLTSISENALTPSLTDKRVFFPYTLQLETKFANDPENLAVYNVDMVTFGETAKLQVKVQTVGDDGETETKTEVIDAEEYPIVGVAQAVEWKLYDNQQVETNVIVSGSYQFAYSGNFSRALYNERMLVDMMNTLSGNEAQVSVTAMSMQTDTLSVTQNVAKILGIGVFSLGIPAALLVICLVVFLKRRHL